MVRGGGQVIGHLIRPQPVHHNANINNAVIFVIITDVDERPIGYRDTVLIKITEDINTNV